MRITTFLNRLTKNPKRVFLMDAFGALLSLFTFLFILIPFQEYFGMPSDILYKLSIIAIFLFLYSFSCFKLIKQHWKPFLKIIIILNTLYIFFSFGLIFYHFKQLTFLGIAYFILEIIVIIIVLFIETNTYLYQKK